jgi:hypothetical protein
VPVDLVGTDGWTPLAVAVDAAIDAACQNNQPVDTRFVRLLLAAGANPRTFQPPGESAIAVAAAYEAGDMLALLKEPA